MAAPRAKSDLTYPRAALLSLGKVQELVGDLSPTVIYEMIAEGTFPNSVQVSARRVAWRAGDVLDWCAKRPASPLKRPPARRSRCDRSVGRT